MPSSFPFLRLPAELRDEVYRHYLEPRPILTKQGTKSYAFSLNIYFVNKQIYDEAERVFRRENTFVKIQSPWPETSNHVATEGSVPIIVDNARADSFRRHYMLVELNSPEYGYSRARWSFVILMEDLPLIGEIWWYSGLDHPQLNHHLTVAFTLRDPYYPADPKPVPIPIQRKLLLPFTTLKEMSAVDVHDFDPRVEEDLRNGMAIPYPTFESCYEQCTELLEAGQRASRNGDFIEALDLYNKAFLAIHIINDGRDRRILGNDFHNNKNFNSGRYKGQDGATVRIQMRMKLVAGVVDAYLKLQNFAEAAFWGQRTIMIMRDNMGTEIDDLLYEWIGALDIGIVYLRTAIAFKKMEEERNPELKHYIDKEFLRSWNLFPIAAKYLSAQHQKLIQDELKANKTEWDGPVFLEEVGSSGAEMYGNGD